MEKRKIPFSKAPKEDGNLADIHVGLYDDVIVFDHVEKVLLNMNLTLMFPSTAVSVVFTLSF